VTSEDKNFCLHYVKKSKIIYIYITKNWLIVIHLPTNTKKCLRYFKNVIVTSLPVTEGTPSFVKF